MQNIRWKAPKQYYVSVIVNDRWDAKKQVVVRLGAEAIKDMAISDTGALLVAFDGEKLVLTPCANPKDGYRASLVKNSKGEYSKAKIRFSLSKLGGLAPVERHYKRHEVVTDDGLIKLPCIRAMFESGFVSIR